MSTVPTVDSSAGLNWVKSSYSSEQGGNCVEAAAVPEGVLVRDSKCSEDIRIASTPAAWSAFVGFAVGAGR